MYLNYGIIGSPNVGKSTLFNAITNSNVDAKNYQFCTIKPNFSAVKILDQRILKLSKTIRSNKIYQSSINFTDIAGIIKNSNKGLGMGNEFLSNIKKTDIIIHVVRCFKDKNIINSLSIVDPINEIKIIETELILSDLQMARKLFYNKEKNNFEKNILNKIIIHLSKFKCLSSLLNISYKEKKYINNSIFITSKKKIYIGNMKDSYFFSNFLLDNLNRFSIKNNIFTFSICSLLEYNITFLLNKIKYLFINNTIKNSILEKINIKIFKLIKIYTFFSLRSKKISSWNIKKNTKSLDAAKKIHTDFRNGFIKVKVISYKDYVKLNKEEKIKKIGKIRYEGKSYVIKDGEIIEFLFKI